MLLAILPPRSVEAGTSIWKASPLCCISGVPCLLGLLVWSRAALAHKEDGRPTAVVVGRGSWVSGRGGV